MQKTQKTRYITTGAIIAALYAVLVVAVPALSRFEFRVSEILTILPVFTPAAIPGLTVGCIAANFTSALGDFNLAGVWDTLFGSCATLIAAILTRRLRGVLITGAKLPIPAALPPVIVNALIIPLEITLVTMSRFDMNTYLYWAGIIAFTQAVTCIVGGLILYKALAGNRVRFTLFGEFHS